MQVEALTREVKLLWGALEEERSLVDTKNEVIQGLQETLIATEQRVRELEGIVTHQEAVMREQEQLALLHEASPPARSPSAASSSSSLLSSLPSRSLTSLMNESLENERAQFFEQRTIATVACEEESRFEVENHCFRQLELLEQLFRVGLDTVVLSSTMQEQAREFRSTEKKLSLATAENERMVSIASYDKLLLSKGNDMLIQRVAQTYATALEERAETLSISRMLYNAVCFSADLSQQDSSETLRMVTFSALEQKSSTVASTVQSLADLHDQVVLEQYTDAVRATKNRSGMGLMVQQFSEWLEGTFRFIGLHFELAGMMAANSIASALKSSGSNVFQQILATRRARELERERAGSTSVARDTSPTPLPTSPPPAKRTFHQDPTGEGQHQRQQDREKITMLEERLQQKTRLLASQQARLVELEEQKAALEQKVSSMRKQLNPSPSPPPTDDGNSSVTESTGGVSSVVEPGEIRHTLMAQAKLLERLEAQEATAFKDRILGTATSFIEEMVEYHYEHMFLMQFQELETLHDSLQTALQNTRAREKSKREWEERESTIASALQSKSRNIEDDFQLDLSVNYGELTLEEKTMVSLAPSSIETILPILWLRSKLELRNFYLAEFATLRSMFHLFYPSQRRVLEGAKTQMIEDRIRMLSAQKDQALTATHWLVNESAAASRQLSALLTRVNSAIRYTGSKGGSGGAPSIMITSAPTPKSQEGPKSPGGSSEGDNLPIITPPSAAVLLPASGRPLSPSSRGTSVDPLELSVTSSTTGGHRRERMQNASTRAMEAAQCNSVCERFLGGVSAMHKHILRVEAELAQCKAELREVRTDATESCRMMDEAQLSQLVEREISDEILVLLRESLRKERTFARNSIVFLTEENAERNIAIRDLQRMVGESQSHAQAGNLAARYLYEAWKAQIETTYEVRKTFLNFCELRTLPSPHQVSAMLVFLHMQLGVVFQEAVDAMYGQFCDLRGAFQQVVEAKKYYLAEVVRMADELFALTSERRVERAGFEWLETHLKENLLEGFLSQQSEHMELYNNLSLHLHATLSEKAEALEEATRSRLEVATLRSRLKHVDEELEEVRLGFDIVNEKAVGAQKQLELKTSEHSRAKEEINNLRSEQSGLLKSTTEVSKDREVLRSLLSAEQTSHNILKDRENMLSREVSQLKETLATAESEISRWRDLVEKEKEAHRATIRSISKR